MPAESKRKFQTGQPVSTRRRAKKARHAAAQIQNNIATPSKKDQRIFAKSLKQTKLYQSDDEEEENDNNDKGHQISGSESVGNDDMEEEEEEEEEKEEELVGKGKKGYREKIKKPSGKKGKVFADTITMLSIIDQVVGKEEERAQIKIENMGKIKSKLDKKEQRHVEKERAKKALIEKKIKEIKRKKAEKRKDKQKAVEMETKTDSSINENRRSVSFQL